MEKAMQVLRAIFQAKVNGACPASVPSADRAALAELTDRIDYDRPAYLRRGIHIRELAMPSTARLEDKCR